MTKQFLQRERDPVRGQLMTAHEVNTHLPCDFAAKSGLQIIDADRLLPRCANWLIHGRARTQRAMFHTCTQVMSYNCSASRTNDTRPIAERAHDARPTCLPRRFARDVLFFSRVQGEQPSGAERVWRVCCSVWPCLHTGLTVGCSGTLGFLRRWRSRFSGGQSARPCL